MTKSEIKRRVKFWQGALFLDVWKIDVKFVDRLPGFRAGGGGKDSHPTIGEVTTVNQYLLADISFVAREIEAISEEEALHEVLHITLSELVCYAKDNMDSTSDKDHLVYLEEQLVERLTRAILKLKKSPPPSKI